MIKSSFTGNLFADFAANTEDTDEMPHHAAFHQGLHCLLRKNITPRTQMHHTCSLEILTCDTLEIFTGFV